MARIASDVTWLVGRTPLVELRRLSAPMLAEPQWTAVRGDADAERELAEALADALRDGIYGR